MKTNSNSEKLKIVSVDENDIPTDLAINKLEVNVYQYKTCRSYSYNIANIKDRSPFNI